MSRSALEADICSGIPWVTGFRRDSSRIPAGFQRDSNGMGVNFTVNHVIGMVQDKKLTGADGSGN